MKDKELQLFIFPYAGGSIAAFRRLTDQIDQRIDVVTVEYAGRGTRAKEPLSESFGEMLSDAVVYCQERRNHDLPYAVMGYSMGSFLSYEMLVNNMLGNGLAHYFISAEISPRIRKTELESMVDPSDGWLIERAKELGGLDERMLDNLRFRDIYLKPMISDFRNLFDYRYRDYGKEIYSDTTFFYCEEDTPKENVQGWEELVVGDFNYYEMGQDHFFINQHYLDMAKIINGKLLGESVKNEI